MGSWGNLSIAFLPVPDTKVNTASLPYCVCAILNASDGGQILLRASPFSPFTEQSSCPLLHNFFSYPPVQKSTWSFRRRNLSLNPTAQSQIQSNHMNSHGQHKQGDFLAGGPQETLQWRWGLQLPTKCVVSSSSELSEPLVDLQASCALPCLRASLQATPWA